MGFGNSGLDSFLSINNLQRFLRLPGARTQHSNYEFVPLITMKDVSRIPPKWRRDLAGEFKSIDQILAEDLKEHVENGTNPFEPPPPPMFDLKPDEKIHDVTGSMVVDNSPKPSRLSNLIEGKKRVNFRDNRSVDVNGD